MPEARGHLPAANKHADASSTSPFRERPVRCTATSGIESMSRPLFGSLPMLSGKRTVDQREHREQREQGASREPARGPQLPHLLRHACEKPEDSAQDPQRRRHPRCQTSRSPRCHVGLLSLTQLKRRMIAHRTTPEQSRCAPSQRSVMWTSSVARGVMPSG